MIIRKTSLFDYLFFSIQLNFWQELFAKVLCNNFNHKTYTKSSLKNYKLEFITYLGLFCKYFILLRIYKHDTPLVFVLHLRRKSSLLFVI